MCDARGLPHPRSPRSPSAPAPADAAWIRRREQFLERRLGPPREPAVYHFDDDRDPHVDVYVHLSRGDEVLVTGGLGDRPQPGIRIGSGEFRRVEVLLRTGRAETDFALILREIADLPFRYGLALRPFGLIQGSRPILPGSRLRHALLVPATDEERLRGLLVEGEEVEFLGVTFLTREELVFAHRQGPEDLADRLEAAGHLRRVDPGREGVIRS